MGHMTVLVLLNDHLDDPGLYGRISEALGKVTHGAESYSSGGVKAFRSFHADETKVFVVGQNTARALLPSPQNVSSTADADVLLHALADALGYGVHKRYVAPPGLGTGPDAEPVGTRPDAKPERLRMNLEADKWL